MTGRTLRLATRGSPLALYQADLVKRLLEVAWPGSLVGIVVVQTDGDRRPELPISAFPGHGLFIAEVELAVLEDRADVAVHSAKDLPAGSPPAGMVLASVPDRADPRDALCGRRLEDLKPGAQVASGSARRRAQLAALRPDLVFSELRGNIATRLERVPYGGAVVVAMAALERLGLAGCVAEVLPTQTMLPQVGQGAIALRCRAADTEVIERLARIDDAGAHRCVLAERAFLAALGGGCDAPVGAHATIVDGVGGAGDLVLEGLLARADGTTVIRRRGRGQDPLRLGTQVAQWVTLADGGRELLELARA